MTKRYVIKLAGGAYFHDGLSRYPTHWLDEEEAKIIVHGKFIKNDPKTGLPIYDPKGFDQRVFHNTWKEQDKATGKLVVKSADSLMILSQDCIGAQVVEAPDDLKTSLVWHERPRPQTINPGIAVREALGLSKEDAQEILGPDVNINDVDDGFYSDLAAMASLAKTANAELLFDIKNSDGSLFKRWRVTANGMFVESR